MQIHTPSIPRTLKITETMVTDFLCDPVLASRYLLNITWDAFQAASLRIEWWVPNVIDESGFGTGKSLRIWAIHQLRAMLIEDQWNCAYYQTFESGKKNFWSLYEGPSMQNRYFRAQLGRVDFEGEETGKSSLRSAACYWQYFRNGSRVLMPAPNWMQNAIGEAGVTLSTVTIDEWTKVETMGKKTGHNVTVNAAGATTGGINQQILGRLRRQCFNQHHPLWGPHCIFSATAEHENHPSQTRVEQFRKAIKKGDPNYAIISFNFKDASNLKSHTGKSFREQIINWKTITNMKNQFTESHFLRECLGIRRRETRGWYSEDKVNACVEAGIGEGVEVMLGRDG
jgi:hypothetical protein